MQQLSSLEASLAKLFKDVPHLPKNVREWIVANAWWLVVIGLILSSLALLATLQSILLGPAFLAPYGIYYSHVFSAAGLVGLAVLIVTIILDAQAIKPLKAKLKRGWDLIFLSVVISIIGSLVQSVLNGNLFGGIIGAALGAALCFYILFEVRGNYIGKPKKLSAADESGL